MPKELDVVRFDVPVGSWPSGTTGTVVDGYNHGGTVEIGDTSEIELVSVDYRDVTVVWDSSQTH